MSNPGQAEFSTAAAGTLQRSDWTLLRVPAGLTLSVLKDQGAPFRGDRYFREFATDVVESPSREQTVAYQPGFLAGSLNRRYEDGEALLDEFNRSIPAGCRAIIGSAAVYVYVIWQHRLSTGAFPLAGGYTWTCDTYPGGHLVVGVFGRERPIVVGPHPKSGRGIGVMPLIVPGGPDEPRVSPR